MHPSPVPARTLVAIAALALFTVFITWRAKLLEMDLDAGHASLAITGKPAPDFHLPATDGRTVSLADFRSKQNVVVTFWASWCGPCRREMPELRTFYTKYHTPASDFEFLAISIDDDRADAETAATQDKLPFPVLLDLHHKVADRYGIRAIPSLVVIDKTGKVTTGEVGFNPGRPALLAQQLGLKGGADAGRH